MSRFNDPEITARVYRHTYGYWAIQNWETREQIGRFFDTELEAYRYANSHGHRVTQ